jgi:membrane-bound lytic murein transglycosylase D
MLALAGYNMGDAQVRRGLEQVAREKGGLRNAAHDFWSLYRMNLLTEETRDYVPQVLAAAIVGAYAARYGLE